MKKAYKVMRMTKEDYHEYMMGGYNFRTEELIIEAENAEEANEKAKAENFIVCGQWTKTVEEIEAEEAAREAKREAAIEKEEKAKAKRKENEARKAAEAGMTVEEYKKEKARKATARRLEREIEELENLLKEKKAYLAKIAG